ncbi:hypothetical protein [Novosphingobium olei]|uniref:Uncharacterized protein n=1 Tax=Novosphingobium olei TaxID=2728851 RepID=A0A7Y0BTW8_9SPHN|nr:hypothetical protein [Novosphingobium olei]NML96313.1 hypothetical protein [Novosphingobium olei]
MTDRFSNFADLAEHLAREIATPDCAWTFMEQTEFAKLSIGMVDSSITDWKITFVDAVAHKRSSALFVIADHGPAAGRA